MSCMFIPLAAAAMSHIPREKMGNATSIFNLMRNIGGSVGIAVMTTLLARRQQFHQNRLVEHLLPGQPYVSGLLQQFTSFFILKGTDPSTASHRAIGSLYGLVHQQAAMLSFVEAFKVMGVVFLVMIPMVALLKDPKHNQGAKPSTSASDPTPDETPAELVHM